MNGDEEERLLYRLDERTARIEKAHLRRLETIEEKVDENSDDIDSLNSRVTRNSTFLGGISTAVVALVLWAADKIAHILHI